MCSYQDDLLAKNRNQISDISGNVLRIFKKYESSLEKSKVLATDRKKAYEDLRTLCIKDVADRRAEIQRLKTDLGKIRAKYNEIMNPPK